MEDETPQILAEHPASRIVSRRGGDVGGEEDSDNEKLGRGFSSRDCDKQAWDTLSKSFKQVQSVLDQNRALIQEVNENHQSKIPGNLVKNVALIREINGNFSKIVSLYSRLSVNFSDIVQQRRPVTGLESGSSGDDDKAKNSVDGDRQEEQD